ncbi:hypothetical protein C7N43_23515 [Sphingobacteriales bacterium UPWRP_1]|nr:hypothetical protein C7N43_23515 [Sphingobacteriales bacterium UPWRP_1]
MINFRGLFFLNNLVLSWQANKKCPDDCSSGHFLLDNQYGYRSLALGAGFTLASVFLSLVSNSFLSFVFLFFLFFFLFFLFFFFFLSFFPFSLALAFSCLPFPSSFTPSALSLASSRATLPCSFAASFCSFFSRCSFSCSSCCCFTDAGLPVAFP